MSNCDRSNPARKRATQYCVKNIMIRFGVRDNLSTCKSEERDKILNINQR